MKWYLQHTCAIRYAISVLFILAGVNTSAAHFHEAVEHGGNNVITHHHSHTHHHHDSPLDIVIVHEHGRQHRQNHVHSGCEQTPIPRKQRQSPAILLYSHAALVIQPVTIQGKLQDITDIQQSSQLVQLEFITVKTKLPPPQFCRPTPNV